MIKNIQVGKIYLDGCHLKGYTKKYLFVEKIEGRYVRFSYLGVKPRVTGGYGISTALEEWIEVDEDN